MKSNFKARLENILLDANLPNELRKLEEEDSLLWDEDAIDLRYSYYAKWYLEKVNSVLEQTSCVKRDILSFDSESKSNVNYLDPLIVKVLIRKIIASGNKVINRLEPGTSSASREILASNIGTAYYVLARDVERMEFKDHLLSKASLLYEYALRNVRIHAKLKNPLACLYLNGRKIFSEIYAINKNRKKKRDLVNLFRSIICAELSEKYGNKNMANYQFIGRRYYELQYIIEKNRDKSGLEEIIDILSYQGFAKYGGGIKEIGESLGGSDVKKLKNAQYIALELALDGFNSSRSHGDNSLDNKSYRGMCLVDMAKLNNYLKKIDGKSLEKILRLADSLLEEVYQERSKIGVDDFHKDCSRLAECEFRLAELVCDNGEKRSLYLDSIYRNLEAINLLRDRGRKIMPEIYSFVASCYFKLVQVAKTNSERRNFFFHALKYFRDAQEAGDNSAVCECKIGNCYSRLLNMNFDKVKHGEVDWIIRSARDSLEKAHEINEKERGYYVYPDILLAFLSRNIKRAGGDLEKYDLKAYDKYAKTALETANRNPNWMVEDTGKRSKNFVCVSLDNYGLLDDFMVLKRGKFGNIEKESEVSKEINNKLEDTFGKDRKFFVPSSFDVIEHWDEDKEMSGTYYVMSREMGMTLEEVLNDSMIGRNEKFDLLKEVINYLSFIHANLKLKEDIKFEHENFIEDRLKKAGVGNEVIKKIVLNYTPVKRDLEEGNYVFYKDAHPRNWLVNRKSNKLIGLDWEEKGHVPAEIDLQGLLECTNLTIDEEFELIEDYNKFYRGYIGKGFLGKNASFRRFLNASVPRAIQKLKWETISNGEKIGALKNAIMSIGEIKKLDNEYYIKFYDNYQGIKEGLDDLIKSLHCH